MTWPLELLSRRFRLKVEDEQRERCARRFFAVQLALPSWRSVVTERPLPKSKIPSKKHPQRRHQSRPRQRRRSGRSEAKSLYGCRSGGYGASARKRLDSPRPFVFNTFTHVDRDVYIKQPRPDDFYP
jgi:hypothetical protein